MSSIHSMRMSAVKVFLPRLTRFSTISSRRLLATQHVNSGLNYDHHADQSAALKNAGLHNQDEEQTVTWKEAFLSSKEGTNSKKIAVMGAMLVVDVALLAFLWQSFKHYFLSKNKLVSAEPLAKRASITS